MRHPAFFPHNDRIAVDPKIMLGKPVIRGTRITVALILNLLAHGYSHDRIVEAYPDVAPEDIQAVMFGSQRLGFYF